MNKRVDYAVLEHEYVTTDVSIRELGRKHDVNWSSVSVQSRRRDWVNKRLAYKDSLARRTWEKVADRSAEDNAAIRSEALLVMRATLHRYAENLRNKEIVVTTKDAAAAISTILLLIGEPTERSEAKIIEFSNAGMDAEFLRRLVETARAGVIEGTAEEPPLLRIEEPRPN